MQVHYSNQEVIFKVVYYGPEQSGKGKSLAMIAELLAHDSTPTVHTKIIDGENARVFLLNPGVQVENFQVKLEFFSPTGKVDDKSNFRQLFSEVDAVAFVADSQRSRREDNLSAWTSLEKTFQTLGINLEQLPVAVQLNKRDVKGAMPVEEMRQDFAYQPAQIFRSNATTGDGVLEAVDWIIDELVNKFRTTYLSSQDVEIPGLQDDELKVSKFLEGAGNLPMYSEEEALDVLHKGLPLENVQVASLSLEHENFVNKVILRGVWVDTVIARDCSFEQDFVIENSHVRNLHMGEVSGNESTPPARAAKFSGPVTLDKVHIDTKLDCYKVCFEKDFKYHGVKLKKDGVANFHSCQWQEGASFRDCEMDSMDMRESFCQSTFEMINCKFLGCLVGWKTKFAGPFVLESSTFEDKMRFREVEFTQNCRVIETHFHKEGFFGESHFHGETSFLGSRFQQEAHFHSSKFYRQATFSKVKAQKFACSEVEFYGRVYARGAELGHLEMERAIFQEEGDFSQSSTQECSLQYSVFKDAAIFTECHFQQECLLDGVRFGQLASFEGAKFDKSISVNHLVADNIVLKWPQVEGKLKSDQEQDHQASFTQYALLKTVFEKQHLFDDMDEAYLRCKISERKTLDFSPANPLSFLKRSFSFLMLDLGFGYGTRPFRITLTSIIAVFIFAILFTVMPGEFNYMGPEQNVSLTFSNALYFSIATFTTMGFGDWVPKPDSFARYIVTAEAFIGLFIMSLFVAAFTRKIIR